MLLLSSIAQADRAPAVLRAFPGIDIVEVSNHHIYSHGGPPAKIAAASFGLDVHDARAHTISVRKIAILWSCAAKPDPRTVRTLKRTGHELRGGDDAVIAFGPARVVTPGGKPARYVVKVNFKEITATEACAFAIDLVVDRVREEIRLPLTIEREAD